MSDGNKAGFLESPARRIVVVVTTGGGDGSEFVTFAFQFLNEVGPKAALAKRFGDFHVNVAIRNM